MDSVRPKRVPWKSWSDFTGWAQDFSLRQKVLGGFLGVVLLVGLATILIGTRLARETIIDRAKIRLFSDLATAGFILKNSQENLELKVRLMAGSEKIKELLGKGEISEVRNGLAKLAVENDLDFLAVTDDKGRVLARAFAPEIKNPDVSSDSLVAAALKGQDSSGVRLVSTEGLSDENPTLIRRLGERTDKKGMILEAAHPLFVGTKVTATLYGGVLLNNNNLIVDRISHRLFR
jgi:two-component system, NtrC family, sensor kinase